MGLDLYLIEDQTLVRGRPSLNRITSDVNKGPGSMGKNEIHIARLPEQNLRAMPFQQQHSKK
jgi:hypothetical protein